MEMAATAPRYTLDDLDALPPDGNRYELLDGVLLVTPAPSRRHQIVASRIQVALASALGSLAHVVGPGVVRRPPSSQLQPDILVTPATHALDTPWEKIPEHWLAIEVYSPSSRIYDREFKQRAYHALGVREVWLVDAVDASIEVCHGHLRHVVRDVLRWRAPESGTVVSIDLRSIFADQ